MYNYYVKQSICRKGLPCTWCHNTVSPTAVTVITIMIHTQVMTHLMSHHSGERCQALAFEL